MNSSITLDDRENLIVTGVRSVENITEERISAFTDRGDLLIEGSGLGTDEFDPKSGVLRVRGRIDRLSYLTEKRHLPDNFISKLFR